MNKIVAYNIKSLPTHMTIEDILEIYHATGLLIYEGPVPYVIDEGNIDQNIVIIDSKQYELERKHTVDV